MSNSANNSSAMSGILRANQVNFSKFSFSDPIVNKYGGKSARVKYDGKDFMIQTPRMKLPFGLGVYEEKDKNGAVIKTKYSLDFSFAGYEDGDDGKPVSPKIREFYDMLNQMQKMLIKAACDNSETWLDMDDISEGVAKALTRDLVKFAKDKVTKKINTKYAPTFKTKLGFWEDRFLVNAFDEDKNKIEDLREYLVRGTQAIGILKLTGVTFAGGKVGYSFQVNQLRLYAPKGLPSYAFLADDEDDTKPVQSAMADKEDSDDSAPAEKKNTVEDSSSDSDSASEDEDDLEVDDESEEEERAPTPPPKKTKAKTTRKKKE